MPQADIFYPLGLAWRRAGGGNVATPAIQEVFASIKNAVVSADSGVGQKPGVCICRGHEVKEFNNKHVFVNIKVLKREHRTDAWMQDLLPELHKEIGGFVPAGLPYQVHLSYLSPYYQQGEN